MIRWAIDLLLVSFFAAVLIVAVSALTGLPLLRSSQYGTEGLVGSLSQFESGLLRLLDYWKTYLIDSHHLFPRFAKLLMWVMALLALVPYAMQKDWRCLATAGGAAVALTTVPLALGLVTTNNPYRYNGVIALALVPCWLLAMTMANAKAEMAPRIVAMVSAAALLLISAGNLAAAQVRLTNLNRVELAMVTQVLAQIQSREQDDWRLAAFGRYSGGSSMTTEGLEPGKSGKWSQPAFIGRRPAPLRPPKIEPQPIANRNQQHLEMQTQIVRKCNFVVEENNRLKNITFQEGCCPGR